MHGLLLAPRFPASSLSHGWVQRASRIALHTRSGGSCNFLFDGKVDWYQVSVPEWMSHNNVSVKKKSSPTMHLHLVLSHVFRMCCSSWGLCKMPQKCFTCLLLNILLLGSSSESCVVHVKWEQERGKQRSSPTWNPGYGYKPVCLI